MAGRLYLFAGGGTGGHLFPGLAVAEALIESESAARIVFVGSDRPIEKEILNATPFEHRILPAVSLAGAMRHPLRLIRGSYRARREAFRVIDQERPAVVIGCGGFASAAPIYAASRRGIQCVLLEQNVIPGRTTRWLSRLGGSVCLSFAETVAHLPKRAHTVFTGNPVRRSIVKLSQAEPLAIRIADTPNQASSPSKTLLVLGGSQGARSINKRLMDFAQNCTSTLNGWTVVHQTGPHDVDEVRNAYASLAIDSDVQPFFVDMTDQYRQASLVVSRAGATTLAELACAGLPALLLPYPHAADNHQWHNARVFSDAGAAHMLQDGQNPLEFRAMLTSLLGDEPRRQSMADAMVGLSRPRAARTIADLVGQLAGDG